MYPIKLRITDPDVIDVFKKVSEFRAYDTKNKYSSDVIKKIGWNVPKQVKKDGFFCKNGIVAITKPELKLNIKPATGRKRGIDAIFDTIF